MIRSRRGQMEMMGLVIVMILVSLTMLFLIQFSLSKSAATGDMFTESQIAKNSLNSMLKTTVACPDYESGVDMTRLIQDCAGMRKLDCDRDGRADSCELAVEVFDRITKETLVKWKTNFELSVYTSEKELIELNNGRCTGTKRTGIYYVPAKHGGAQKLFVRLDLC